MSLSSLRITPKENSLPELPEMQCPIKERLQHFIDCEQEMDRNELAAHLSFYHPEYVADPDPYFDSEREQRFGGQRHMPRIKRFK